MREDFRQSGRKLFDSLQPSLKKLSVLSFFYSKACILLIIMILNCIIVDALPLTKRDDMMQGLRNNDELNAGTIVRPPHCSKAIVTVSQSSRLTRRSTSTLGQQMSLNVGIDQSICFKLNDKGKEVNDSEVSAEQDPLTTRNDRRIIRPIQKNYAALKNRRALNPALIGEKNLMRAIPNLSLSNSTHKQILNATSPSSESATENNNDSEDDDNRTTTINEMGKAKRNEDFDNNLLHTLTLVELEQYYRITERYKFAIPEVETNCICECNPLASTCQADEWKYGECVASNTNPGNNHFGSSPACHRTFFPNQPSGACPTGSTGGDSPTSLSSSRLCCQTRFRVHQNRVFTALRLEMLSSYAVLQYAVFQFQTDAKTTSEKLNISESAENRKHRAQSGDEWRERDRRRLSVPMDGTLHNFPLDSRTGLKLSILGLGGNFASNQLDSGMYFVENLSDNKFGEIMSQPLNRITEHDFHKLGWFRVSDSYDNGAEAFVQSGDIFIDKIHHAKTNNCADQKFRSVLDASYYLNHDEQPNNSTASFRLAEPLNRIHRWIRSARIYGDGSLRQAIVLAGEGANLDITLTIPTIPQPSSDYASSEDRRYPMRRQKNRNISLVHTPTISFVHNSSKLIEFSGVILVDKFSNTFLNLSLYGAQGLLNGYVRQMEDPTAEDIDSFSIIVPQQSAKPSLSASLPFIAVSLERLRMPQQQYVDVVTMMERVKPYPINTVQMVCLRPDDGDSSLELCRPVPSVEIDLEVNTVRNEWNHQTGVCNECNQVTVDGFMKYLNPMNWTKGVNSVSDALMLVSNMIAYIFGFLILYFVITKIVIPLAYCCFCPMQIFYSKTKAMAFGSSSKSPKSKKAQQKPNIKPKKGKLTKY